MTQGTIKTMFQGDPNGLLAAHAQISKAQKEMDEGYSRTGRSAKQMGQDINAALGMVNHETVEMGRKFKDAYLSIEYGARSTANSIKAAFMDVSAALGGVVKPDGWGLMSGMGKGQLDIAREREKWTDLGRAGAATLKMLDDGQNKHNSAIKETGSLMSGWARSAMSVAASYIGIQEAINLVMQADRAHKEMQSSARTAQLNAAGAHAMMFENVGSDKAAFDSLLEESNAISSEYGISDQDAMARLMATTTSKMAGDPKRGAEIARVTAGVKRFSLPDDGAQYATGVANLMLAVPGMTAEQASGMLLSLGTESSIVQQSMLSQYVTPTALAGMATSDLTKVSRLDVAKEGLAGAATLAKFSGDEEGRTASTNWNLFASTTAEFVKEKGMQDAGTAMRRVDAMSPAQLGELEGKLQGDARLKPFVTLLAVRKDKDMRAFYDKTLGAMSDDPTRHRDHVKNLATLTGSTSTAASAGETEALKKLAELARDQDAKAAEVGTKLSAAHTSQLALAGSDQYPFIGFENAGIAAADYFSSRGALDQAKARRATLANQINANKKYFGSGEFPVSGDYRGEMATQEGLLRQMDNLIKVMEENNRLIQKNNEAMDNNPAGGGPGGIGGDQKRRQGRP